MDQPLTASEARKLGRQIVETGTVVFTQHALDELAKDGKTTLDATNVLRGGAYSEAEWENGGWRYHAFTQRFTVVIEFESETELVVVTGWARR
jgi:hypothetical protein